MIRNGRNWGNPCSKSFDEIRCLGLGPRSNVRSVGVIWLFCGSFVGVILHRPKRTKPPKRGLYKDYPRLVDIMRDTIINRMTALDHHRYNVALSLDIDRKTLRKYLKVYQSEGYYMAPGGLDGRGERCKEGAHTSEFEDVPGEGQGSTESTQT